MNSCSRNGKLGASSKSGRQLEAVIQRRWSWRGCDFQAGELDTSRTSLSRRELAQLLSSLILMEQSGQKLESGFPLSGLKTLLDQLHQKKTNVYRSIPYSRLGSNRDAHCYRKAYPHLLAFKRSCVEGGQILVQSGKFENVLEFVLGAWQCASELPQWDTSNHNSIREQCYHALAGYCTAALQHHRPRASKARELLRRFKVAQVQKQVMSSCIRQLEQLVQAPKVYKGEQSSLHRQNSTED
ncbi:uncharacterized protein LOC113578260 isoform X2 [Electrophorus electricus]|uniref:uncharacterized protein LOC113578260 isoform X2 n=1 Tax=Electrophorus electricus TaxID=8005 RepID=UPI0015CFA6E6|nr:uncharacterized protein LOC113578260 isoform X2 [Electrophorus electricus]